MKNSIVSGAAKELICMTHGHDLRGGIPGGNMGTGWRGIKGENGDNCNSIINKIHLRRK